MSQAKVNPGVAAALSAFMTGLGQIYCGRIGRGLLIMFAGPLVLVLFFFLMVMGSVSGAQTAEQAAGGVGAAYILLMVGGFGYWIFNIYDAYSVACTVNQGSGRGRRRGRGRDRDRRRRSRSDDDARRSRRYDDEVSDAKPRRRSKVARKSRPARRVGRTRSRY